MLVIGCLSATMLVCGALAAEVARARRALRNTAAQTLRDYAGYAGRVVGMELFRQAQQTRDALFAHILSERTGEPVSLHEFARGAADVFAADYEPDPYRGYLRVDLETLGWQGAGSLRDSVFARAWVDTLDEIRRSPRLPWSSGVLLHTGPQATLSGSYAIVRDRRTAHLIAYLVVQDRALSFRHMAATVMRETPLLPLSFASSEWNIDAAPGVRAVLSTNSLLGVRIRDAAGRELYRSPRWFRSPYDVSYAVQSGPGRFSIQTVLRPGLEHQLVPASLDGSSWLVYGGVAFLGVSLLTVSFVAFWGEMQRREAERVRGLEHLVTGLRHELNNALASVLLEAQLLESSPDVAPSVRESASAIAEQSERMRDVIRRLDHVDRLPVVDYFNGRSMVDLTATSSHPVPVTPPPPDGTPRAA